MDLLIILLRILEVVVCLLLVGVILLQRSKSSGAGVSFGGGAAEAVFGAQMGNVLTKATVILAVIFLSNTLLLSILIARQGGIGGESSIMGNEVPAPVAAPAQQPVSPAAMPESTTPTDAAGSALDDLPAEIVAPEAAQDDSAPAVAPEVAAPVVPVPAEAPKATEAEAPAAE